MKRYFAVTSLLLAVALADDALECLLEFDNVSPGTVMSEIEGSSGCFGSNLIPGVIKTHGYARTVAGGAPHASTTAKQARENVAALDPASNRMTTFDSTCGNATSSKACDSAADDPDLFQFALRNTVILQENVGGVPDDNRMGGCFYFDFRQFGFGGSVGPQTC
mmetsp:Transcript_8118/g.25059  ORF Transcript_8118/g.25059 Transcript_8118/m.25059 type:complete len:164 (+) Transcript_8118:124-615(+)